MSDMPACLIDSGDTMEG